MERGEQYIDYVPKCVFKEVYKRLSPLFLFWKTGKGATPQVHKSRFSKPDRSTNICITVYLSKAKCLYEDGKAHSSYANRRL